MRNIFLLTFILMIFVFQVSGQKKDNILRERIYLQTDKQTYLSGEFIWLKIITTTETGLPVSFSKIAYVELLDGNTTYMQIKMDVEHGTGNGCMVVPANIPTGYYRIIAYTRYMRNEDESVLFEKNISILNPLDISTAEKSTSPFQKTASGQPVGNNTLALSTNRSIYSKRENVLVNMENLPEDIYTLSVAVTGKDMVPSQEPYNLGQQKKHLSGSKSTTIPFSGKYLQEYEGHIVTGKLIDIITEKPKFDTNIVPIISYIGNQIYLFPGKVDQNGDILFLTNCISGAKELISTLISYTDKQYRVDIESPFITKFKEKKFPVLRTEIMDQNALLERSIGIQVLYNFMTDSINQLSSPKSFFTWKPDQTYLMEEYTRFASMQEVITEFVTFARFRNINKKRMLSVYNTLTGYASGATLVLVDGIPLFDHDILYNYDPELIKKIEVYQDSYLFGEQIIDGIVSFTTHNNNYPNLKLEGSTQFFDYEGTLAKRKFYSPVYNTEPERQSRLPDFRHTLFWEPDLKIEDETSKIISFYTSDLPGEYTITVEGLTRQGEVIYASSSFVVREQ